ncbi:hypothetical protein K469DRAFT_700393 [Zopfia rhizophila CBS 207.26]|uniref:Uncharacterized protein n=1 Tax=Zopfia rhizophila CBS 207.26 TaxID=1314779 RepID=A0A6A6DCI5_9PEZI|nr:hypothetical protein K469DRAFT_700393 [Zopfia rhizophila CBS 207.26]
MKCIACSGTAAFEVSIRCPYTAFCRSLSGYTFFFLVLEALLRLYPLFGFRFSNSPPPYCEV